MSGAAERLKRALSPSPSQLDALAWNDVRRESLQDMPRTVSGANGPFGLQPGGSDWPSQRAAAFVPAPPPRPPAPELRGILPPPSRLTAPARPLRLDSDGLSTASPVHITSHGPNQKLAPAAVCSGHRPP